MDTTLGLSSTTTVGMVLCVHGHTTDGRTDVEPALSACLTELSKLLVDIAGNSDGGTAVLMDQTDFTTLQADGNVLGQLLEPLPF